MNTKLLILGAVALGAMIYLTADFGADRTPEDLQAFQAFQRKYRKVSLSAEDFDFRFNVYVDNRRYVEAINAENRGYILGVNEFSDLTFEEFSAKYLGEVKEQSLERPTANPNFKLIGSKDWTKEGKVTPVKNQGSCGSCWAFSATGSLETAYALKYDKLIGWSESELVDCSSAYGNLGCNGGEMTDAFKYIKDHKLASETAYPYVPRTRKCAADYTKDDRVAITEFKILENPVVEDLIKLIDINTVSIGIEVQREFQMYRSGIFKGSPGCGRRLNHGVLATGYDTCPETKEDFFHVKNSWGAGWGENGYIRVLVGTGAGTCGVASRDDVYPIIA
jgi:hypothetical protein